GRRGSAAGGQRHVPPARPGRADAGSIVARPPADQRDAAPVVQRECSPVPPGGASGRRALVGGRQTRRPGGRRHGTPSDSACFRGARASFLHEEANSFTHSQTESDTLFVGSPPSMFTAFLEACRIAEGESNFIRNAGRYPLCGCGDINTYALFAVVSLKH